MAERLVVFADQTTESNDASTSTTSSYQLLALPPALLTQLVASTSTSTALFEIRGDGNDSAVLVTESQTYSLRGVQNSNSLCVCTGSSDSSGSEAASSNGSGRKRWFGARSLDGIGGEEDHDDEDGVATKRKRRDEPRIEIETVLHETLELVPAVARLEKLERLLRGTEYTGDEALELREGSKVRRPPGFRTMAADLFIPFQQSFTFDSLRSRLPASDAEIRKALLRHRVVTTHNGSLRPLPPAYLLQLLPAVLSALPLPARLAHPDRAAGKKSLRQQKGKNKASDAAAADPLRVDADEQDLLDALDAAECGDEDIARQFLEFFGTRGDLGKRSKWDLDALAVVKELGIVLLAQGGVRLHSLSLCDYAPASRDSCRLGD